MLHSDEVDNEALQARIDLSMAYTHELVSSWIKPSVKSALKSRNETDKELEEYMRRPPRLGVGAPIPESFSRETVRLKGRLTNKSEKKRAREEEAEGKRQVSDDEEESRAGAIKKKARLDVFGGVVNKRKRKGEEEIPLSQTAPGPGSASNMAEQSETGIRDDEKVTFDISMLSEGISTPRKEKRKKRKKRRGSLLRTPSPGASPVVTTPGSANGRKGEELELPQTPVKVPLPGKKIYSPGCKVIDISLILASPNGLSSPARAEASQVTAALQLPLLNLDGPPVVENREGDETTHGSPKKKRKRRKKRKSSLANVTMEEVA